MILGFLASWLVITIGLPALTPADYAVTIEEYGLIYFLVTSIPIGLIFVVWLDYVIGAKILPD